ncbi:CinA-like protein [Bacteroidia bacterium]|nr:CinA-like protein [Bacteroidia bacterium]
MNTEIITIGDELLIGQVIDTNSAWMGEALEREGFKVSRKTAVGDVEEDMLDAIDSALKRADIVLLTGGIGPTKDDITRSTLCHYFDCGLHFSDEVYENVERIFYNSGRGMNELTRNQALVPDACTVIQNRAGTAPCTWFERDGKVLVSMPGVPHEMKWLMTNEIIPRLKQHFCRDLFILHKTMWVTGFGESALAIELTDFENELPSFIRLAYLPQPGLVRLRLTANTQNEEEAWKAIALQQEKLRQILGNHIITEEDKPIEVLIGEALLAKGLTMGTAESCTGGHIASMITSIPGSSRYFKGGVVSYSNDVKSDVLGVSTEDLEKHGAVSQPVVEQMAKGALRVLDCDCAVATSGIAGPDGGTKEKPVGTVWIAVATGKGVVSECYHFTTVRDTNVLRASSMALLMLLDQLHHNRL